MNCPTISTIGIPTRNRLLSLKACLISYLENCQRHGRSPEFVVADDSDPDAASGSRALLQELARQFDARIRRVGREEKLRFAAMLAKEAHVSSEIVRFALFGHEVAELSTGGNRNSLLLDTVGTLVLSVDDDTLCRIAAAREQQTELSFFPRYDPTEFWFFPRREDALRSLSFLDTDVLACHEGLLGSSVTELAGERSGRVAMTLHGLAGDSGMASPRYYLSLSGVSRDRLTASAYAYKSALTSREVLRCVCQPMVAATPFCMTTFLGLDNRSVLPPFFPIQRNSDGIFGHILHKCVGGSHTAFLPSILLHAPEPPRVFARGDLWAGASSLRMSDIVISAALGRETRREDESTEARLADLGKHLRWLGSVRLEDFEEYLRTVQKFRNFEFTTVLHSHLQTCGASPAFWADDVNRMIELTTQGSDREDYIIPQDLCRGEPGEARRLSQELVGKFGELIEAWPAIFKAALQLRSSGIRMSATVAR